MENGAEVLAKIPNPNAGSVKYVVVVASEVGILDYVRNVSLLARLLLTQTSSC